jgi:hypothetical protein
MNGLPIDHGDMETLAAILESEKRSHTRTRSLCFALFVFCFLTMLVAVCVVAFLVFRNQLSGGSLTLVQVLAPLGALVVGFFTSWWTAQNCINSIERTLFAARSGRHRLFVSFLEQLQCADKKKKRMILDVVSSFVN